MSAQEYREGCSKLVHHLPRPAMRVRKGDPPALENASAGRRSAAVTRPRRTAQERAGTRKVGRESGEL